MIIYNFCGTINHPHQLCGLSNINGLSILQLGFTYFTIYCIAFLDLYSAAHSSGHTVVPPV